VTILIEERNDSTRTRLRFHVRQVRRHLAAIAKICLGIKEDPPPLSVLHEPDDEKHPSCACPCPCGPDADHGEHRIDCPWAAEMCLHCNGHGYCPQCGGDGTDPAGVTRPPEPSVKA
jgi:hypothetical protein